MPEAEAWQKGACKDGSIALRFMRNKTLEGCDITEPPGRWPMKAHFPGGHVALINSSIKRVKETSRDESQAAFKPGEILSLKCRLV